MTLLPARDLPRLMMPHRAVPLSLEECVIIHRLPSPLGEGLLRWRPQRDQQRGDRDNSPARHPSAAPTPLLVPRYAAWQRHHRTVTWRLEQVWF